MIRSLAHRVILAEGLSRAAIAFGAGAAGALAMPPFGFWPALAVSLTAAVWLLDGSGGGSRLRTLGRSAAAGWCWGLGYFTAGLWWIGAAFLVEADTFAWLLPFGVLGLPAVLAGFPAFGFALARAVWSPGAGRLFALAFGLGAAEWLRGHLFTGFPWNALGLALGQGTWLMQTASLVGLWGLTLLAILLLAAPATLGTEDGAGRSGPPVAALLALGGMAAYGAWRLPTGPLPAVPGVKLRLMQPNLAQDAKFGPAQGGEILRSYLALSAGQAGDGLAGVTHLVWPESAFPFLLHREPNALAGIAGLLRGGGAPGGGSGGAVLVTGAARQGEALPGEARGRFYNAIQAVGPDGAILGTYDKTHLVPFGEYVPGFLDTALRSLGLRQFVTIPGGFAPGETRRPLRIPGLPAVLPTVCYEAIFPDEIGVPGPRPGLILNVTNDGWFGATPGPYQHLAQARLRAVEQGLPLVRAANTGISAIIDPYGRPEASLPLGQAGTLDASLPVAIPEPPAAAFPLAIAAALYTTCLAFAIASVVARRPSELESSHRP